jgi:hypothetical protein
VDWKSDADVKRTQVVLEQYKAYIGDLGNIGTRYAAVHALYFTLLGAIVAVLGLTESGKALGPLRPHAVWIVALFGVGLCLLWIATVRYYRALFAAKFQVLRELEAELPVKPYISETRLLGLKSGAAEPAAPRSKLRAVLERFIAAVCQPRILTVIERLIPFAFIGLIVALAWYADKQPAPETPAQARRAR